VKSLDNKVCVVTGAGSGIGRHLAINLAKEGAILALSDINADNLKETISLAKLPKKRVLTRTFDVGNKQDFHDFSATVEKEFGHVDVVINNAGVTVSETIEDTAYEDFEWLMNINFWGVVYGTKAFLPILKRSPEACIVNISSIFGFVGIPSQGAYNASKFAVRGFTEALRLELKDTSVTPICVHPGGIKTNIVNNARVFSGFTANQSKDDLKSLFDKMTYTQPEQAANTIIKGIKKKQRRVLIGPDARAYDFMARVFPNHYDIVLDKLLRWVS